MALHSSISSTIDRITSNAIEAGSTTVDQFVPSATWQGEKKGYYFGTSTHGTGYYLDANLSGTSRSHSMDKKRSQDEYAEQEYVHDDRQKKVRFGQDEIKTIPAKTSAAELLEQAEQEQQAQGRKALDLSRGKSSLKHIVANLEKSIATNQLQRSEFPDSPENFMESEIALYEDIEQLNDLAASLELYLDFVDLGAVDQLVVLLEHENEDIALSVIRLFVELLDSTLHTGEDDSGLAAMMKRFIGNGDAKDGGLVMSISNITRLQDKKDEEDLKGIEDLMNLVENMLDLDQTGILSIDSGESDEPQRRSVVSVIASSTSFVPYLLAMLTNKSSEWNKSLRLHASELLATIFQHEDGRRIFSDLTRLPSVSPVLDDHRKHDSSENFYIDGMECLLQCIAVYRKTQPSSDEECEYLENVFDCLAASLLSETNIQNFLDGEGIELMLRCINEGVHSGFGAMKILYFALTGLASFQSSCCKTASEVFIDAGGLKSIFPIFMGRKAKIPKPSKYSDAGNVDLLEKYVILKANGTNQKKKLSKKMKDVLSASKDWYESIEGFSIQIIYALTMHIGDYSPYDSKSRLLAKFIENDGEKCDRIVELCLKYDKKMRKAEYDYYKSDEAEQAEMNGIDVDLAAISAKLQGGGEIFYRLSAIIAYISINSKRCHRCILDQLHTQNSGIGLIKGAIDEFVGILDDSVFRRLLKKITSEI